MVSIDGDARIYFPSRILENNVKNASNIFDEKLEISTFSGDIFIRVSEERVKKLDEAIVMANRKMEFTQTGLKFIKHEKLNEFYIQIIDVDNNVIKEIPPKKELDFFAAFLEFNHIFDEKI